MGSLIRRLLGLFRRVPGHISKPVILVELNPPALQKVSGCTPSEMVELLASLGYACYALENALPGSRITTATPVTSMRSAVCLPDGQ